MPSPFVRVVGVALALTACHKTEPNGPVYPDHHNPPPPEPEPSLPTWDEVASGHPEGATNPPRPVLVVSQNPEACFKRWEGSMRPPSREVMVIDGEVVATPADAANATQVVCPEGQPAALLAAYEAWKRDGEK
jgi:hypothetical protein